MSPSGFIKNIAKGRVESVTAIVAALLVLFATMMEWYVSAGMAVTLLVTLGVYEFDKTHKQEKDLYS